MPELKAKVLPSSLWPITNSVGLMGTATRSQANCEGMLRDGTLSRFDAYASLQPEIPTSIENWFCSNG